MTRERKAQRTEPVVLSLACKLDCRFKTISLAQRKGRSAVSTAEEGL